VGEHVAVILARILAVPALLALGSTAVAQEGVPPRVRTTLPDWRAPGGAFVVGGSAAAGARVRVTAGELVLGAARAGAGGRFRLVARAPSRSGRYRPTVESRGATTRLGSLRVRPVRIAAAGDFTPGDRIAQLAATRGARYPWLSVGPLLKAADVATLNLEGAVSSRGVAVADKEYHFRGPRSVLAGAVAAAGLDVLTVANNHSLDFGRDAFVDTIRAARSLGIRTVGGGATLAQARAPAIVEAGGLRIAFLGYSDVVPYGFAATSTSAGTTRADPEVIREDVRRALRSADVVVCWFHWGVELAPAPTARQVQLASDCLNAGAKLVLGSHPHVLQPFAVPARGLLVAFSLGNFVFPASSPRTEKTGVLEVDVASDGVRGFRLDRATIVGGQPRLSAPRRGRPRSPRHAGTG
jgi:poly-gamma-glutamate capsule biosynthesis protein CapA/YwtB (metallophosphatase superfamily)